MWNQVLFGKIEVNSPLRLSYFESFFQLGDLFNTVLNLIFSCQIDLSKYNVFQENPSKMTKKMLSGWFGKLLKFIEWSGQIISQPSFRPSKMPEQFESSVNFVVVYPLIVMLLQPKVPNIHMFVTEFLTIDVAGVCSINSVAVFCRFRRAVDGCSSYQKLWILLEQPVVLEWHLWKVERCSRMFVRFTGSWKKKHVWYDTESLIENTRCKWLKVMKAIITLMILYEMILIIFTRCWFVFEGFQHPVQLFFWWKAPVHGVNLFNRSGEPAQNEWPQNRSNEQTNRYDRSRGTQSAISIWDIAIWMILIWTLFDDSTLINGGMRTCLSQQVMFFFVGRAM